MVERRFSMRYESKSKATSRLTLLGARGEQLLRIIGMEPSAAGIIAPAAMPAAMVAIASAIEQEDVQAQRRPANDAFLGDGHNAAIRQVVTLRQCAWPFVEMMKRAHRDGKAIVWGA
ncbi:MAG TPA: DUF1840 family protein [Burkholderiaceae bacterium]|nr:DUF1840 family protein [Burkholderiaceae bacterium]